MSAWPLKDPGAGFMFRALSYDLSNYMPAISSKKLNLIEVQIFVLFKIIKT